MLYLLQISPCNSYFFPPCLISLFRGHREVSKWSISNEMQSSKNLFNFPVRGIREIEHSRSRDFSMIPFDYASKINMLNNRVSIYNFKFQIWKFKFVSKYNYILDMHTCYTFPSRRIRRFNTVRSFRNFWISNNDLWTYIYSDVRVEIDLRHRTCKIKTRVFTASRVVTLLTACRNL